VPSEAEPSRRVVEQRIRNRIIEYLELASSYEMQRDYQARAPVSVPSEVINQWEDWVHRPDFPPITSPVFSREEREAIAAFHQTWNAVADSTPNLLPSIEETLALPQWRELATAAARALQAFGVRGRLPEDREV